MIKLFSDSHLVCFDGTVLEIFLTRGETKRFHVDLIQKIELEERRGNYSLSFDYTPFNMPEKIGVGSKNIAQAEQLIRAIEEAINTK